MIAVKFCGVVAVPLQWRSALAGIEFVVEQDCGTVSSKPTPLPT
ncbi:hypothetical protein [Mycobacterium heckeshornense]|nr:hypothetical protein [Mycobacterium heckeshornense]